MTKEIHTEILIHATPERVWSILTDFENYPIWNPFIIHVDGQVEKGHKIKVKISPPESNAMTFRPVITARMENRELKWLGSVLFRGVFDGEHCFQLIDNGNGTTTFVQSERFNGILVGLFNLDQTTNGFKAMNQKLKELAE